MPHKKKQLVFVIHEHHARRLHYDVRLEQDGALKSWAVPKQPPRRPGIRRLAIHVPDHELAYADFEGEIEEGEYGAGMVKLWDKGTYILLHEATHELIFELKGKKMKGVYCLIKFKGPKTKGNEWLFFKKRK